jgi:uncharacterized protein YecE (DUF72 family)
MGWSYDFWRGSFYPHDLEPREFLAFYAQQFCSVEVDSTFYRIPRAQTVSEWKEQTPEGFVFSLKFPKKITHVKLLKDAEEETRVFLERAELLEEKLGVLLLQFPPFFGQPHLPVLAGYLKMLPKQYRYAVEVRNKSLLNEQVFGLLREHGVALAWVGAPKMPLITEATADFAYVRWEGDRKTVTETLGKTETDRTRDTQVWAEKLKRLVDGGTEVFGYFSKYYSGFPPSDIREILKYMQTPEQ